MAAKENTAEELIHTFMTDYMEKIFYFCLKKTGTTEEAEDLASDITINIIAGLRSGTVPLNYSAWVWRIVRNRYSVWADKKHKQTKLIVGVDIEEYEVADQAQASPAEEYLHVEDIQLLRRELAFISSEYRELIVAYYMEDRKISDIAKSLGQPEGTVKAKLFRSRQKLKEGMKMAREFGVRSYKPEDVSFAMSGTQGRNGEPWTLLDSALKNNILLEAYNNPSTLEQLAVELGVAMPYMAETVQKLHKGTLLQESNGKYETAFYIVSREAQTAAYNRMRTVIGSFTKQLADFLEAKREYGQSSGYIWYEGCQPWEDMKWTLLLRYTDDLFVETLLSRGYQSNTRIRRPNGGYWDVMGFEEYDGWSPQFVGLHGSELDIPFGQYKISYKNIQYKTQNQLSTAYSKNLLLVLSGRQNECEPEYLQKLIASGYLKEEQGICTPAFLILRERSAAAAQPLVPKWNVLLESAWQYVDFIADVFQKDSPASLDQHQRDYALQDFLFLMRGAVLEEALRTGYIDYADDDKRTMLGTFYIKESL